MSTAYSKESYYEVLRVSQRADLSEITAAYHAAKNAFSIDSLATYSLLPAEESAQILKQIESAYLTLTNPDKRREYDLKLASGENFVEPELKAEPPKPSKDIVVPEPPSIDSQGEINLYMVRESRKLSLDDVSRITKIPRRYLQALEQFDTKALPAQVYIQGFLKNLAQLYRLDTKLTVSKYMEKLNRLTGNSQP